MIVYKTTNLLNGKFYVGKDSKNNPDYLGSGLILNRAIKKYGRENFVKEVLEVCATPKQLDERERFWIDKLQATTVGYNIAKGGSGGDTYTFNPDLETIREKFKGVNNPFYGKSHSSDTCDKISKKTTGRKSWNGGKNGIYSEATIKLMSESSKGQRIILDPDEIVKIFEANDKKKQPTWKHFGVSNTTLNKYLLQIYGKTHF